MSTTFIGDVSNQIQKFWSPLFEEELKEQTLLPSLVSKKYAGSIKAGGDTVYVSQINRPTGEIRTIGTDADTFNTEKLSTSRVSIQASKRIVAAFEFEDMVMLQSQIGDQDSAIRKALLESVEIQLNNYLYSVVSPSTATPNHLLSGVSDMNAAQINIMRKLASQSQWSRNEGWWLLADPSYYSDILNASTLTSQDYVAGETPVVGGQIVNKRFGFNILEDNSAGLLTLSPASAGADCALAFHPDFTHLVMGQPNFKVSDLHSNKQFGFVISVDMWCGAALGNDGDIKHIQVYNT